MNLDGVFVYRRATICCVLVFLSLISLGVWRQQTRHGADEDSEQSRAIAINTLHSEQYVGLDRGDGSIAEFLNSPFLRPLRVAPELSRMSSDSTDDDTRSVWSTAVVHRDLKPDRGEATLFQVVGPREFETPIVEAATSAGLSAADSILLAVETQEGSRAPIPPESIVGASYYLDAWIEFDESGEISALVAPRAERKMAEIAMLASELNLNQRDTVMRLFDGASPERERALAIMERLTVVEEVEEVRWVELPVQERHVDAGFAPPEILERYRTVLLFLELDGTSIRDDEIVEIHSSQGMIATVRAAVISQGFPVSLNRYYVPGMWEIQVRSDDQKPGTGRLAATLGHR